MAEGIAWAAAQAHAPADECYVDCMVDPILRKWGRYWEALPHGAHVREAVGRAAEAAAMAARSSCDPGWADPDATRESARRLAAALARVNVPGKDALVQSLREIHDSCGEPALRGNGETAGQHVLLWDEGGVRPLLPGPLRGRRPGRPGLRRSSVRRVPA